VSAKYAFISSEEGTYPISKMCGWSDVSRSGYHSWKHRTPSERARRRAELTELVRFSFEESDETYGYRRVHADLLGWGYEVDDETVRSIMREQGLVACQPKPWRPVTTIAGDASDLPDLVERDFTAHAPATKLVGDITYIRTWEGWLYLATVLDCFTKKVVGYAMADHMRTARATRHHDHAHRSRHPIHVG
jgi:transposase InsO family protein